ncbi:MAG: hypothetical protein A2751_04570 [Candidatus Doudnabacteria bacterium RIFCSPHIGHO2_01_FULL_46_14]|uniref:UDP-N-acetylmuramate--L-alanine ligase n=1 Tax=Candidatus Doudnabacteria bacterium RIFCSPHIGHO2_01_FULL_46_14 TaxID=1817824 RepID=A0A1F5NNH3_9BACT|nr:MAG: hypothetical protein A2751_04570 [Candidatus Doudnabacteria bacterium RIFCSPHIGHO2_01_FULL_46_14]
MFTAKKIHIIGIGGVGISALAKVLEAQGAIISGSDLEAGGHRAENVAENTQLVIYSNAVPEDNVERAKARRLGIKELSYPEALGEFCKSKKIIAVAGTNGKTTTTAMVGWIMQQAGLDPTVVVGSKVLDWDSNARTGKGEYVVLEADEYRRAFLNYQPDIAVITNIAADHMDYYKNLDDIKTAFFQFTQKIKPGGTLIFNVADGNTASVAEKFEGEAIGFASAGNFRLLVPGDFNQANAQAAAAAARVLAVPQNTIEKALAEFSGTWRRFERIGKLGRAQIISDYTHHPDGIVVTLKTANELYGDATLAVFQPHQHNRTKKLFKEFVKAFCKSSVQDVIISEIFEVAGREDREDQDISSRDLVREIKKCGKNAMYSRDLAECEKKIRGIAEKYKAVVIMGAGDIYKMADQLVADRSSLKI